MVATFLCRIFVSVARIFQTKCAVPNFAQLPVYVALDVEKKNGGYFIQSFSVVQMLLQTSIHICKFVTDSVFFGVSFSKHDP